MAAQMSLAENQETEALAQFKQLIQENLQVEEYEGWLERLEVYISDKELVFANIGHQIFREDIVRNHGLLFHDLAEQCFPDLPQKVKFMVGRPKMEKRDAPPVETAPPPEEEQTTKVIKFPPRPSDHHVEYPTDLTRITPFKPLPPFKQRTYIKEVLISNKYGYVSFSGIELGIDDEDVFMLLLDMASEELKNKPPKEVIRLEFTFRSFLRRLKRSEGGHDIEWLNTSLDRLAEAVITFKPKRFKVKGALISKLKTDEETGKCIVLLNSDFAQIYIKKAYTFIDFDQRLTLKKSTTKRLHAYINGQRSRSKKTIYYTDRDAKEFLQLKSDIREVRRNLKECHKELIDTGFLKIVDVRSVAKGKKGYHVEIAD